MRHLADLLLENYRTGRPLLTGAMLYRGTAIPDQSAVSRKSSLLHTSLSISVADRYANQHRDHASAAHYIGEYPLHRGARFHSDMGAESGRVGLTVEEVEKRLQPMIERFESLPSKDKNISGLRLDVEVFTEKHCHEAMIPARERDGQPVRPETLYEVSSGRLAPGQCFRDPHEIISGALEVSDARSIADAKAAILRDVRCTAEQSVASAMARNGAGRLPPDAAENLAQAQSALREMIVDKREQELARHMGLPLNDFMTAVRNEPPSAEREQIAALGTDLVQRAVAGDRNAVMEASRIKNLSRDSGSHDIQRVAAYARGETPAQSKQQQAQHNHDSQRRESHKMSWEERSNPDRVHELFEKAFDIARERDAAAARPTFDQAANQFSRESTAAVLDRGGPSFERAMDFTP